MAFSESNAVRPRALVLDAVGTLIHPEPSVARVYADVATRHGRSFSIDVVQRRFRKAFSRDERAEDLDAHITDELREEGRWRDIVAEVLPGLDDPEAVFRELWDHFANPVAWRCFPDVGTTLATVQTMGIPVCVASNFDRRLNGVVVGLPEMAWLRDSLVISSETGFRKPHPRFYEVVCQRLKVPPSSILWVGDDPENDVAGPRRLGLQAILIDRRGSSGSETRMVRTLDEILPYLNGAEDYGQA